MIDEDELDVSSLIDGASGVTAIYDIRHQDGWGFYQETTVSGRRTQDQTTDIDYVLKCSL